MDGLSFSIFDSVVKGGDFMQKLSPESYSHTIKAQGGYWQASLSFPTDKTSGEAWFENGLNRQLVVYNQGGGVVWEGFVNKINLNTGPLIISRGPLLESSNRVRVLYPPANNSIYPPVVAPSISSASTNDTTQQDFYGIIESVLSNSPISQAEAEQVRDTFLQANKDPAINQQLTIPATQQTRITLECLGFINWFRAYTYSNTNTGTQDADEKIRNVITADINSIFSTDYENIVSNTFQVTKNENGEAFAFDVIKEVVSVGDGSDNRYTFGIYKDKKAKYQLKESGLYYQQKLSDPGSKIKLMSGGKIDPWDILPGKWLFISDFLVGRSFDTVTLTDDPRNLYIEEVRFTMPYQVNLIGKKPNGERASSPLLNGISARLGLIGVG